MIRPAWEAMRSVALVVALLSFPAFAADYTPWAGRSAPLVTTAIGREQAQYARSCCSLDRLHAGDDRWTRRIIRSGLLRACTPYISRAMACLMVDTASRAAWLLASAPSDSASSAPS